MQECTTPVYKEIIFKTCQITDCYKVTDIDYDSENSFSTLVILI